jgi:branched-chain amino acid transport system ATP-binding protein
VNGNRVLQVSNVHLRFGGVHALNDVNIEVFRGEFLGIIGPNGAGKTTLFNVITGVLRPNQGSVLFGARNLVNDTPDTICRLGIARTYQKVRPFGRLSVFENVLVPIVNRDNPKLSSAEAQDLAWNLLGRVGLTELADREARHVNLFHRKKIELARALGTGAKVILLDEVMAGLNHVEADGAVDLLRALKSDFDLTIICIEHLMRIVMAISDRVVVLDHGQVIANGTPAAVAGDPRVQTAYLGADHA